MVKPNEVVKKFNVSTPSWKVHIPNDLENYPIQVIGKKHCYGKISMDFAKVDINENNTKIEYFAFSNYLCIDGSSYNLSEVNNFDVRLTCGNCCTILPLVENKQYRKCKNCTNKSDLVKDHIAYIMKHYDKLCKDFPDSEFLASLK